MSSLCQLASDYRGTLPPEGMAYEEKRDGFRALYFRGHDGQPRLWTRNGMRIEGAEHILHRLKQMERAAGQPLFLDGEFQVDDSLAATKEWCERGWKLGGEAGHFYAFDAIPYVNWIRGGWEKPWTYRKAWLVKLAEQADDPSLSWEWAEGSRGRWEASNAVTVLEDGWCFTPADVANEARRVWARGGEGIMLKSAEAPYLRRRCDAWLKVKAENQHKWMRKAA